MAVTKRMKRMQNQTDTTKSNSSLNALTAAALALPGLVLPAAQAADDEFGVQYGHYQEENRDLYGVESEFRPITVDTLQGVRPSEDVFYKGRRGPKFVNCPWIDSPDCSVMLRPDTMVEKVTSIKVQQAD